MLLPTSEASPVNTADPLSQEEIRTALEGLSAADWTRARRWAGFRAHNLPSWTGDDLLQEAMCKFLDGERAWKRGTAPLVALAYAVKSISSNVRKGATSGAINFKVQVDAAAFVDDELEHRHAGVDAIDHRTPESSLEAKSELAALSKSLEGDENVELVAMAWMDKLRGKEAAEAAGLDEKTYDAARKRLMRKLDEFKTPGRST